MSGFIKRLLNGRKSKSNDLLLSGASPGDGVGYPVPYDGERLVVDHDLLKKCKSLSPYSGAYRLNETTVIKTGEATHLAEAATMRLVAEKTKIPVPKVLDSYIQESDGRGVILMEFVEGETLDKAWPRLTTEQRQHIVSQLKGHLEELRSIQNDKISATDGSPCNDQFFTDDSADRGPFETETSFHEALAQVLRAKSDDSWSAMVSRFLTSLNSHSIVLTHSDLAPRNILIRDGNVAAILDWELAGFYPDYWEYVKTYLWADWNTTWVAERIPDRILTPKLTELAYLLHARDLCR